MSLPPGRMLGPYEVLSPIGAGGMGEVLKAKDTRLQRTVAVKVLPTELASDAERRGRFEREAHAASALNHRNITTVFDIGEDEGTHYIVMELVEGKTLRELLDEGPVSTEKHSSPQYGRGPATFKLWTCWRRCIKRERMSLFWMNSSLFWRVPAHPKRTRRVRRLR